LVEILEELFSQHYPKMVGVKVGKMEYYLTTCLKQLVDISQVETLRADCCGGGAAVLRVVVM
jgi:hypothetical protein